MISCAIAVRTERRGRRLWSALGERVSGREARSSAVSDGPVWRRAPLLHVVTEVV